MKILVLNGSPKREGSTTLRLTQAFLSGVASVTETEVTTIHVADLSLAFCSGCLTCMRNGGHCIHRDDMTGLLDTMRHSDVLLYSFPLYCYGIPAPLKNLLDRTMPLYSLAMQEEAGRYTHVAQSVNPAWKHVMISGCGFPDVTGNFEGAVTAFRYLYPHNATVITVPEAPLFTREATDVTAPRLALLRQAGAEFAARGEVSGACLAELAAPVIPPARYVQTVNALPPLAWNAPADPTSDSAVPDGHGQEKTHG